MDDSPSGLRERPLQRQPSLAFVGGPGCALPRPPVHLGLRRLLAEAQHGQATRAQLIFGASRGQRHVAPVAVRAGPLGNSVAELTHRSASNLLKTHSPHPGVRLPRAAGALAVDRIPERTERGDRIVGAPRWLTVWSGVVAPHRTTEEVFPALDTFG